MHNFIHRAIFIIGSRIRSPEIKEKYNFLKESEAWTREELELYQFELVKRLIHKAYSQSPFYKKLYDENQVSIDEIKTLKDLGKIPTISKADLLNYRDEIQNTEGYRKLFFSETSGSTGEPLIFHRNSEWDAGHRAAQFRGYSWYGVHPWDRNGYFWGYNFNGVTRYKVKFLDTLMNRFRLFSYSAKDIEVFSKELKNADYIEGYSSMIYEVAKVINRSNLGPYNLKMVKGTSEKIFDSYQPESLEAYGKRIVSEYGAAETGIIAFECPEGNMHITMENVIVEHENGEAIITNLLSDSFPIIRYKLGDSIDIDEDTRCECGMNHSIVTDVLGRIGKVIYGKSETFPSLTLYYIFKNLILEYNIQVNYQAVQKKKGSLEIYLDCNVSEDELKIIETECNRYFRNEMSLHIMPNQLVRDYSGKFKDFVSEIED